MTNETIIMMHSISLMEQGLLKGSGIFGKIVDEEGAEKVIELPEVIHTFAAWKKLGFTVKKGEHSSIKFPIWKYSEKAKKEEELTGNPIEDAPVGKMFMKMASFFTADQVEQIQ